MELIKFDLDNQEYTLRSVELEGQVYYSVYDFLSITSDDTNSRRLWKRIKEDQGVPELYSFKFPGRGQQETPIADRQQLLEILALLPGKAGKKYRQEAAKLVIRYLDADITLADDILQRSNQEDAEWLAQRAKTKVARLGFANELTNRGVKGNEIGRLTNDIYRGVLGGNTEQVKNSKGLPAKANLRDNLNKNELLLLMASEALSTVLFSMNESQGYIPCKVDVKTATNSVMQPVYDALDKSSVININF